jgi:transposase
MEYTRKKIISISFNVSVYKALFVRHRSEHMRKRLRTIAYYYDGFSILEIGVKLDISHQTVRKYLNIYLKSGFDGLCSPIKRPKKSLLSAAQCADFKAILLSKRPEEVGLEGNIWTGKLMCDYLKMTYGIAYKSGIYDLLRRMRLSHQKAHADYGNASPEQQVNFLEDLKNTLLAADEHTAVFKFDEFSVGQKPSSYYGWAEKNTRPMVKTDEKKETAPMVY